MEYPKINTLFLRDEHNLIIPSSYTKDEFRYLESCQFECTEKIDGTNIRIELTAGDNGKFDMCFKGRTDKAVIPEHLLMRLHELFDNIEWENIFTNVTPGTDITLYGEGYGMKIQKGMNYIKDGCDFILFDIRIGKWWLSRLDCEDIARKLEIKTVPLIGYMTIGEAIEYVKNGFKSTIAQNKEYDAEGLVCKTPHGLLLRDGSRIIFKLKTCDFIKLKNHEADKTLV